MTRVAVASHNPIKALAVEQAFRCMFPERDVEIRPVSVESGVSDQPDTSDETRKGAVNRARAAKAALPDADYWVGIEGGIEDSPAGMEAFAWIVALSTRGFGQGKTASFFLPDDVANLVRGGLELGAEPFAGNGGPSRDLVFDAHVRPPKGCLPIGVSCAKRKGCTQIGTWI